MIKRILLTLIMVLVCSFVNAATQQVIMGGSADALNTAGTTEWVTWSGSSTETVIDWTTTEENASLVLPTEGTIDDLRVSLSAAPDNGAGTQSYTFLFRIDTGSGFADTTLTCAVSEAETTCNNSDGFSVSQGDVVSFQHIGANTPAASTARWSVTWNPTVANESIMLTNTGSQEVGYTSYYQMGGPGVIDTTAEDRETVIPTAGTFSKLTADISAAPGASGSWTISFGTVDCDITNPDTTCNSGADTQAVTQGQVYNLAFTETGSVVNSRKSVGIVFKPTVEGEWIVAWSTDDNLPTESDEFNPFSSGMYVSSATEATFQQLGQAGTFATGMTFEDICIKHEGGLGDAPNSYTHTLRVDGVDSSLAVEITAANQPTVCASSSVSISDDDLLNIKVSPFSTPGTGDYRGSMTGYIPPSGGETAHTQFITFN